MRMVQHSAATQYDEGSKTTVCFNPDSSSFGSLSPPRTLLFSHAAKHPSLVCFYVQELVIQGDVMDGLAALLMEKCRLPRKLVQMLPGGRANKRR